MLPERLLGFGVRSYFQVVCDAAVVTVDQLIVVAHLPVGIALTNFSHANLKAFARDLRLPFCIEQLT